MRIRAILRSLVPIEDLVGVISLPVQIPAFGKGNNKERFCRQKLEFLPFLHFLSYCAHYISDNSVIEPKMSASFVPDHKAPMVLFLDRVYGIDNQDFLLHVLEVGFLPDMRAAASLDTVRCLLYHSLLTKMLSVTAFIQMMVLKWEMWVQV